MEKYCIFCWNIYKKRDNESLKIWNNRKFCSQKCKQESQKWQKLTEEQCIKRRKYNRDKICLNCWKEFSSIHKENKFCCSKCSSDYRKWKEVPSKKWQIPWNKWKTWFKHSEESKEKMSKAQSWEKSYLWKWWITKLSFKIRNSKKNKDWRNSVFKRDKYSCVECWDKKWWNLISHHIKEFSLIMKENNIDTFEKAISCYELWDINNWVTLCEECHKKKHPELKIIWLWKSSSVARNLVK